VPINRRKRRTGKSVNDVPPHLPNSICLEIIEIVEKEERRREGKKGYISPAVEFRKKKIS